MTPREKKKKSQNGERRKILARRKSVNVWGNQRENEGLEKRKRHKQNRMNYKEKKMNKMRER